MPPASTPCPAGAHCATCKAGASTDSDCLTCGAVLSAECSGPLTDPGGGDTGIDAGTAIGCSIQVGGVGNGGNNCDGSSNFGGDDQSGR